MLALIGRTVEFLVYHVLVHVVDRVSRLPRSRVQPEVEQILRENLALKAQVRALVLELKSDRGMRPRVSLRTRGAQVFAYLLTRAGRCRARLASGLAPEKAAAGREDRSISLELLVLESTEVSDE